MRFRIQGWLVVISMVLSLAGTPATATTHHGTPVVTSSPGLIAQVGRKYSYVVTAEDPDGDPLSISVLMAPESASWDPTTHTLRWTPLDTELGIAHITIEVNDGNSGPIRQDFDVRALADFCPIYPIALPGSIVGGLEIGATVEQMPRGTGAGNFGWLSWSGSVSAPTLAHSLLPPGDSYAYVNPDLPEDSLLEIGDWAQGATGSMNASQVRTNLDALLNTDIILPVWSATRGQGSHFDYQISQFATVRLSDYRLNGHGWISWEFRGYASCYNQPPVAVDQSLETDEDVPLAIELTGNDPDNDLLNFSIVEEPAHGSLSGTAPNFIYTPDADFNGTDAFLFHVSDGSLLSSDAEISLTVRPVNDPPTATSESLEAVEDIPTAVTLQGNDIDGDALAYEVVHAPLHGSLSGAGSSLIYAPDENYFGPDEFVFRANDGVADSALASVTIAVAPVNDPPSIISSPVTSATVGSEYQYDVDAVDVDGDVLAYSLEGAPVGMSIDSMTGAIVWVPTEVSSEDVFNVFAVDGQGGSASQTIGVVVSAANLPPQITSTPATQVLDEDTYTYDVDASDPDVDDQLTYALETSPTHANIDSANGVIEWAPDDAQAEGVRLLNRACRRPTVASLGTLQPIVKWQWNAEQILSMPAVAPLIDFNMDGVVDGSDRPVIVVMSYSGFIDGAQGKIRVIDPVDGSLIFSVLQPDLLGRASSHVAIGDLENDGHPEIVYYSYGGGIIVLNGDGSLKWKTTLPGNNSGYNYGAPTLADLDGDGSVEILAREYVFNSDGSVRFHAPAGYYAHPIIDVAVDLDMDGTQEVIIGRRAFTQDGQLIWDGVGLGDYEHGHAIGNLDDDPAPEIVVGSNTHVSAINSDGSLLWRVASPAYNGGALAIADLDGDGVPEIVGLRNKLTAFRNDGSIMWESPANDGSDVTGVTVFDFDGDGAVEVVYADSSNLRIHDGRTGALIWSVPNYSATAMEFPVVVDADQDGHADILLVSDGGSTVGMRMLSDANNSWVATRSIWNQYAYSIDNVNDDASIPAHPQAGWLTHNTFRLNSFPAGGPLALPDLALFDLRLDESSGSSIKLTVKNRGLRSSGGESVVRFYDGVPDQGGILIGELSIPELGSGEEMALALDNLPPGSVDRDIYAQVDPNAAVEECDESNNMAAASYFAVKVSDPQALFDTQRFTVRVENRNHAPTIQPAQLTDGNVNQPYRFKLVASDPDRGDGLLFSLASGPAGLQIEAVSGELRWIPTNTDVGVHSLTVRVTDLGGLSDERTFDLVVTDNHAPVIESSPALTVEAGSLYTYAVAATDPDGDSVQFALQESPPTMFINASTGLIQWSSLSTDVGTHSVVVQADDGRGGMTEQAYVLTVTGLPNQAPIITSAPQTNAYPGIAYSYDVAAIDPDNDTLTYSIAEAPSGMSIAAGTGQITWTPSADQLGTHYATLQVDDGRGGFATQRWSILVAQSTGGGGNQAPIITSSPVGTTVLGDTYLYAVAASDPDADPLSYVLSEAPPGMVIGATSGVLSWTPSPAQVGTHPVTVRVSDGRGGAAWQSSVILVTAPSGGSNHAPTILSTPSAQAKVGIAYQYALNAFDADGDTLSYSLSDGPVDMVVDGSTGQLLWTPAATGTVAVRVRVSDGQSWVEQGWNLSVIDAGIPLSASLSVAPNPVVPGGDLTIGLVVNGASGDLSVTATLDGVPLQLLAQGNITVPAPETVGLHTISVVVSDGNDTVTQISDFNVEETGSSEAPSVQILAPTESADEDILVITSPTEVVGRVLDDNLVSWALTLKERGGSAVTNVAEGTSIADGVTLGTIDPTLMQNGQYVLILQGTDANGQTASDSRALIIEGDMKLGQFSMTFEDLSIPVAGLPVRVTRTYDTRQRSSNLDFGYGWSVDYQNVRVQESRRPGFAWNLTPYPSGPLGLIPNWCVESALGNVVSVTLGDGKVEKFRAKASPACNQGAPILDVQIVFEAMEGTHSQLRALNKALGRLINGSLADPFDPGNPLDPSRYLLTTPEGREFTLDQGFTVREVLEREGGNTITFDENGIIHSSGLSVVFVRDAQGRITEVHAPDGTVLRYEYDAQGNLSAFVDATGARTTYTYLARGGHYLEEIIDPRGVHVARNEYDDAGRLIAVIDADGRRIEYDHDIDGRAETIRDRRGITTVYVYNDRGDVLAETNGAGETTLRTYDSNGSPLTETNALGETRSWTYDQKGNVLTETNAAGETVSNVYGPFNQLDTQTDALGHVTLKNDYLNVTVGGEPIYPGPLYSIADANGNRTRFGYDTAGQLNALTDPTGAVSRMTYDTKGFLIARVEADGSRTDIVNDVMGRTLSETRSRTRADGTLETLLTEYTLDAKGRVTATHHPDGSVTHTDYDANDKPVSTCDALNRCTAMHYDDQGRLDRTDYADGSAESSEYDANGNVIARTDRLGRTTRMLYDAANRQTATIYPDATPADDSDNPRSTTGYDAVGRVLTSTDENGHSTRYEYDAAGRRTAVVMTAVNGVEARTVTAYDAAGRRSATIDAEGHTIGYLYDAAGRLTNTLYDDGNSSTIEYDAAGRKTADIDPDGRRTEYVYDANGRLDEVRLAAGTPEQTITTYAYDEVGNKIRQTDAEGRVTGWEYDAMGREIARILPEGQRESKAWNAAGELESATDFNGQTTHYTHDVTGRLASIDYPHDADVSFTYNAAGERTSVLDGRGSSTTSYDARGRVLQSLDADGGLIEYQYDAAGNLLARISPSQSLVYAYDARNRLDTVTRTIDGEAPSVTRYTYDEDGNRTTMIGGAGTQTAYAYDGRHRLRSLIKRTAASALLLAMNYNVDASGLRSHIEESDPAGIVRTVDYQYDALKRLTDETIDHRDDLNDRSSHWAYDRVGNRLQQVVSISGLTTTTDYSYDNNDRLQSETTGGSPTSYSYDANGNTKAKVGPGINVAYDYNDANRLIQASTASGTTSYVYNADGLRTRQTHTPTGGSESTIWYVQDSAYPYAQVIEEYQSQGSGPKTLSATYTFADDLVSQTRYDSAGTPVTSYIQADGFGSTRWLTDNTGTITDSIDYDAFGVEIRRSGTAELEHLYRGERFDANVGFYDLRARLYDPANGRFLTQDSFAGFGMDPRSLHKYGYSHNDPVNNFDPSGHLSLISVGTAINIIGIGSTTIHAGFRIAEGDYQGAAKEVARDAVFWALGAGTGRLIAPLGRSAMALFSRTFFVPLEQGLARSGTVLTRNMEAVMARAGMLKPPGWQAHHIVGEAYAEGKAAMDILRRFKIDVNSPLNGVFLPGCRATGSAGIVGLAVHCGKHVQAYERYVLESLEAAQRSESSVVNALSQIREELMTGQLFLNVRGNL